jgi:3-oxoadipate CoA-transferase, alpha subunit
MINKIVQTMAEAMAGIDDGAVVLLGGFGSIGQPNALIDGLIEHGAIDLTVVSNNAGAGIPAFFTATAVGTKLAAGKEQREIGGRQYLLEQALAADVALIEAWEADRWGNLTYRSSARNFNPVMAMAAALTIAQVQHIVDLGALDPEKIATPGIYVNRVLHVPYGEPTVT